MRLEKSQRERSYLKHISNAPNSEIKGRINHARMPLAKFGNILTKIERKAIRDELYRLENTKLTRTEKQRAVAYLVQITNTLYNKQKYNNSNHHDQTYYGIKDIEQLFNTTNHNDYYKLILARISFENSFEEYEMRGDKNKNLLLKPDLTIIIPHLTKLVDEEKNSRQNEQKIQLIIAVILKQITDLVKKYTFYVKSKNIEIRSGDNTNDIITKLLESFLEKYEREENILRNGSNYVFDCVDLTLMQFHSIELKRGSSYIPSPKWISDKRATINPKNLNDNNCFAYAIIAALHHEEIKNASQRITKLIPYIDNYNWKDIDFPPEQKDWKTFERNNKDIALNILSASSTEKKLNLIRKSEYNDTRKKQVVLLMITDIQNNWHCKKHI